MQEIDRRTFLTALIVSLVTAPPTVEAQQVAKMRRIGTLDYGSEAARKELWKAFREGLHELGYIEGRNITLESRWANGAASELPRLVGAVEA